MGLLPLQHLPLLRNFAIFQQAVVIVTNGRCSSLLSLLPLRGPACLGASPAAHLEYLLVLAVKFSSMPSFACLGRAVEKGHDLVDANPGHFRHCRTKLAALEATYT